MKIYQATIPYPQINCSSDIKIKFAIGKKTDEAQISSCRSLEEVPREIWKEKRN
jgi:hypothetical protein